MSDWKLVSYKKKQNKVKLNEKAWTHVYLIGRFIDKEGNILSEQNDYHSLLSEEYKKLYEEYKNGNNKLIHKLIQMNKQIDEVVNNNIFLKKYENGEILKS